VVCPGRDHQPPVQDRAHPPRGPWRTVEQVEVATAEWVDWFNYRRLYEYNSDLPPAEPEDAYCAQQRAQPVADVSNQ